MADTASPPKKSKKSKKERKNKKEKKRKREEVDLGLSSLPSPKASKGGKGKTETCVLPLLDPALVAGDVEKTSSKVWLCRVPNTSEFNLAEVTKFIEGLTPRKFADKMEAGSLLGTGDDDSGGDGERFELRAGDLGEGGGVTRVLVPGEAGEAGEEMKLGRPFDGQVYVCLGGNSDSE